MECSVIGIDLSKNIFHIVAINHRGLILKRIKCSRQDLLKRVRQFPTKVRVCMEACQGAHYWCRELKKSGYDANQIAAQHVKRYLKKQKNDYNDAEAIAEAGSRAETQFIPVKSAEQQELMAVVSVRERLVKHKTALMNQARGILAEQGKILPQGRTALARYLSSEMLEVSAYLRGLLSSILEELHATEVRIESIDKTIRIRAAACSTVKRLQTIPGVGVMTAVSLATLSGNPREFKNGRQFAANLGLVPRQHSSGGKTVLLGITKRGDKQRRSLLVLGAHSVIMQAVGKKRSNPHSLWIRKLYDNKGANLTAVALAAKNARIAWCILTTPGLTYSEQLCH